LGYQLIPKKHKTIFLAKNEERGGEVETKFGVVVFLFYSRQKGGKKL
jgi:hypothetical protein